MFRPNRIGTPLIWTPTNTASVVNWTPNTNANVANVIEGNVINASPDLDFGATMLTWQAAAENIPAGEKLALLHQFTISTPLKGNAVGVEISADLDISIEDSTLITPIFCKLAAAGAGAVLDPVASGVGGIRFGPVLPPTTATPAATWRAARYENKQIVVRDPTRTAIGGTYAHGFLIYNLEAGNQPIDAFHMHAAVRQLNDQQLTDYRDTLR